MNFDFSQSLIIPGAIVFPGVIFPEPFPQAVGAEQIDITGSDGTNPPNLVIIGGSV